MRTLEGKFNGKGLKIGIVAGRFNKFITSKKTTEVVLKYSYFFMFDTVYFFHCNPTEPFP